MAAITTTPFHRTRTAAPVRPAERTPEPDVVPGPDEHTLARTTAVVVTSLMLMIGVLVAVAWGVGSAVNGVVRWFMG